MMNSKKNSIPYDQDYDTAAEKLLHDLDSWLHGDLPDGDTPEDDEEDEEEDEDDDEDSVPESNISEEYLNCLDLRDIYRQEEPIDFRDWDELEDDNRPDPEEPIGFLF